PGYLVESFLASVEMVRTVVGRKPVGLPIQRKHTLHDAVAVASNDSSHERVVILDVTVAIVITENHIINVSCAIGHKDRGNDSTVGNGMHFHSVRIFQDDDVLWLRFAARQKKQQEKCKPQITITELPVRDAHGYDFFTEFHHFSDGTISM